LIRLKILEEFILNGKIPVVTDAVFQKQLPFLRMASLPSGKSATGLSAIGRLHSRYYWPMTKTAYTH